MIREVESEKSRKERGGWGQFPEEAWGIADRAHMPIEAEWNLAARHPKWTGGDIGVAIYIYTMWVMRRMRNDSMGSKINRRAQVEAELEITMGDKG